MFPLFSGNTFRMFFVQFLENEAEKQKEDERGAAGLDYPTVAVAVPAGDADVQDVGSGNCPYGSGCKHQCML